jgi:hypothetical protein
MALYPPFPKIRWDTGPIIILIIKLQKISYTALSKLQTRIVFGVFLRSGLIHKTNSFLIFADAFFLEQHEYEMQLVFQQGFGISWSPVIDRVRLGKLQS